MLKKGHGYLSFFDVVLCGVIYLMITIIYLPILIPTCNGKM